MALVSVIIANYNKKDYLSTCLQSLKRQSYADMEVIVVDNASSDGSVEMIKDNFPWVKLIVNQKNELYCRAQNQGINQSNGKFILSLNNDVILQENYIQELVKVMENNRTVGLATGKIMLMDKKTIDTTGQFLGRSRKPVERGYKKPDKGQFESSGYVFGVGGVAAFYRRQMLEEIKLDNEYFDEDYCLFYEDLDISWRANLYGWKAFYTSLAVGYHIRGGTSKSKKPPVKLFDNYDFVHLPRNLKLHLVKNRYITMIKNDSLKRIILNLPFILLYELKLWTYICIFTPCLILDMVRNMRYLNAAFKKRNIIRSCASVKNKMIKS